MLRLTKRWATQRWRFVTAAWLLLFVFPAFAQCMDGLAIHADHGTRVVASSPATGTWNAVSSPASGRHLDHCQPLAAEPSAALASASTSARVHDAAAADAPALAPTGHERLDGTFRTAFINATTRPLVAATPVYLQSRRLRI